MDELFGNTGSLIISAPNIGYQRLQTRPKTTSLIESDIRRNKRGANTAAYSTYETKFAIASQNEDLEMDTPDILNKSTESEVK